MIFWIRWYMATENIQYLSISSPQLAVSLCIVLSTLRIFVSFYSDPFLLHLTSVCEFPLWIFICIPFLELSRLISFLLLTAKGSVSSPLKQEITPYRNYVQVYIFIQYFPSLPQEGWQSKTLLFNPRDTWKSNCVLEKKSTFELPL